MQGLLHIPEKSNCSCISPNVPETLRHHLHILRIRRRAQWIPFYNWYWQSRPDNPSTMIGGALALILDQEAYDRQGLPQAKRKEWQDAVSDFTSTNQNISSATTVRRFSKTLRDYDNTLHEYACAKPKKPKHLEAIFAAKLVYEASTCTTQDVAPQIAQLAARHFETNDTVSKVSDNQAAWQNFQATARVKQEAKHGFKLGFCLGVAMLAVVAVTVAAIVFSGGLAAIPVLAGAVAAHTAVTTVAVGTAACAALPIAIGGLFGSLGAGVQRLAEWGSRRVVVTNLINNVRPAATAVPGPLEVVNPIDDVRPAATAVPAPLEVVNPIDDVRPAATAVPAPVNSGSASSNAASSPTEVVVTNPIYALPAAATVVPALRGFEPAPRSAAGSPTAKLRRAGAPTGSLSDGFDESVVPLAAAAGPGGLYAVVRPMTPPSPVFAPEGESPQA